MKKQVVLYGTLMNQRDDHSAVKLFSFSALAKDIMDWSKIIRTEESREGTQRSLVDSRWKAVKRFFKDNAKNVIPSSVLLSFEPGTITVEEMPLGNVDYNNTCDGKVKIALIKFSYTKDQKPAYIVDGQHRLRGITEYTEENVPVFATALIDADLSERAFQFIVVNNKTTKVKTTNLKSIIANIDSGLDKELLSKRLQAAGIRLDEQNLLTDINNLENSPFKDILNWEYNIKGDKIVDVSAIEDCMKFISKVFTFCEEDVHLDMFFTIWSAVKNNYASMWGRKDFKLMQKVCINALNEFLVESIRSSWLSGQLDPFKMDEIKAFVVTQMQKLTDQFWVIAWNAKVRVADNANMRSLIKNDIQQIIQNIMLDKHWDDEVYLASAE